MIIDTGITENELLASLIADELPRFDPQTMVCAAQLAARLGCSESTAMRKLRAKEAAGTVKGIRVTFANGQAGYAFVAA